MAIVMLLLGRARNSSRIGYIGGLAQQILSQKKRKDTIVVTFCIKVKDPYRIASNLPFSYVALSLTDIIFGLKQSYGIYTIPYLNDASAANAGIYMIP